jgi:cysteine/glycine-rich protein
MCKKCAKRVYPAEKVSVEQTIFHIECLRCAQENCNKKMSPATFGGFVSQEGSDPLTYCTIHYNRLVAASGNAIAFSKTGMPKEQKEKDPNAPQAPSKYGGGAGESCMGCGKRVYPAEKMALEGQTWHGDCLRCVEEGCNKKITGANYGGFVPPDNKAYCKVHYAKLAAAVGNSIALSKTGVPKSEGSASPSPLAGKFGGGLKEDCRGCGKRVYPAEKVQLEGQIWHDNCLRCKDCSKKITGANFGGFVPPDNTCYCKIHYDRLVATAGNAIAFSGSTASTSKWQINQNAV